jgi:hypothetical protein
MDRARSLPGAARRALREYRDAVGRRTREILGGFRPEEWSGEVAADAVERAAAAGAFGARTEALVKAFPDARVPSC